jgi:hypothetical protein
LDGFLVAPPQILLDLAFVLEIVRDRAVNFPQAEGWKIILDLLGGCPASELAHNGIEWHARASNADRPIFPKPQGSNLGCF